MTTTLKELIGSRTLPDDVVFAEPWEARAFAMAVTLFENGRFSWNEFREHLVEEIARADSAAALGDAPVEAGAYYECWLRALEKLLGARGILSAAEIERRAEAIAASPPAPNKALSRSPIKIA
jgi:nitrile hydratase accessory protein